MIRKIIFTFIILTAIWASVASVDAANFTRIVPSTDVVIVNQTSVYSTEWTTPLVFFLLTVVVGLAMFYLSIVMPPEMPYDLIGWLSPIPLLFSSIMLFLGIDVRTSAGLSAVSDSGTTTLMMLENHTIYKPWLLTIFIFVLFLLSLVNISRIQKAKADQLIKSPED